MFFPHVSVARCKSNIQCIVHQCNSSAHCCLYISEYVSSLSYYNNLPYLGTLRKSLNLARRQQNLKTETTTISSQTMLGWAKKYKSQRQYTFNMCARYCGSDNDVVWARMVRFRVDWRRILENFWSNNIWNIVKYIPSMEITVWKSVQFNQHIFFILLTNCKLYYFWLSSITIRFFLFIKWSHGMLFYIS